MPTATAHACAVCKYQRRKCTPGCILAPYFPHDRQRQFLHAHKLFGVRNITKIVKKLKSPERNIAMRTIMFQADARANDPAGGCFRIVRELQYQIDCTMAELELVLQQLAICRARARENQELSLGCYGHFPEQQHYIFNHEHNVQGEMVMFSGANGHVTGCDHGKPVLEVSNGPHEAKFEPDGFPETRDRWCRKS